MSFLLEINVGISFDKKLLKQIVVDDKQLFARQLQHLHNQVKDCSLKINNMIADLLHPENSQLLLVNMQETLVISNQHLIKYLKMFSSMQVYLKYVEIHQKFNYTNIYIYII